MCQRGHFLRLHREAILDELGYTCRRELRSPILFSPIHQGAGSRTAIRGRMDSFNQTGTLLTTVASMFSNMVEWIGTHEIQISLGHAVRINWCSTVIHDD
jgi:hypothetical protein